MLSRFLYHAEQQIPGLIVWFVAPVVAVVQVHHEVMVAQVSSLSSGSATHKRLIR